MPTTKTADADRRIAAIVSVLLLFATYLAFSFRAITNPVEPGELLSEKRLIIVALGTGLFWLIARYARHSWVGQARRRFAGVAIRFVVALAVVLASRIAFDLWFSGEGKAEFVRNLRWTMIWAGYFGMALLGYLAAIMVQSMRDGAFIGRGSREDRLASVLNEVSTWSAGDRRTLAALIDHPARYAEADPLFVEETLS